jgi:hypothetical protein
LNPFATIIESSSSTGSDEEKNNLDEDNKKVFKNYLN